MKAFFRYLRGELLSGFYIRAINLLPNKLPSLLSIKEEFLYWLNVQFDVDDPSYPLRFTDLKGIATVAGVVFRRGLSGLLIGLFRVTESYIVDGREYGERGLLRQDQSAFEFYRTDQNEYDTDITTLATASMPDALRSPLVPSKLDNIGRVVFDPITGAPLPPEPVGYVWGDASSHENINENGMVPGAVLHPEPPPLDGSGGQIAYAPWYGNQYLPLAEEFPVMSHLEPELIACVLEIHQKIRYNGLGLMYLFEITEKLMGDLISNMKIEISEYMTFYYYRLTFDLDRTKMIEGNGWGRFSVWDFFVSSKYPYIRYDV